MGDEDMTQLAPERHEHSPYEQEVRDATEADADYDADEEGASDDRS